MEYFPGLVSMLVLECINYFSTPKLIAMMAKPVLLALCVIIASTTNAQTGTQGTFNVSVGFSFERLNAFSGKALDDKLSNPKSDVSVGGWNGHNLPGFAIAAGYKLRERLSVVMDLSAHYGSATAELPGGVYRAPNNGTLLIIPNMITKGKISDYRLQAGVSADGSTVSGGIVPFAFAMAGVASQRMKYRNLPEQRKNLIGGREAIDGVFFSPRLGIGAKKALSSRLFAKLSLSYSPVFITSETLLREGEQVDTKVQSPNGGGTVWTSLQTRSVPSKFQSGFSVSVAVGWQ